MWTRYLLGGVLLGAVGCGGGPTLAPVSGKVTLDGKPLAGAGVVFSPFAARAGADASVGKTNENGEYTLETMNDQPGAVAGPHRVSISCLAEEVGDTDGRPKRKRGNPPTVDKVPTRYQGKDSELKFDVIPGQDNRADFALKSKAK